MSAQGIRRPGIYMIPAERYHQDPVVRPSLSHSVLRTMLDRSELHAWAAHPRLNPDFEAPEPTPQMIQGSVLHRLILGRGDAIEVIDAPDFRTKAAQEARDAAFARGAAPILRDAYVKMEKAAAAVLRQLREIPEAASFFSPGRSEAVAIARMGPVWCRCMVDRLPDDGSFLWDVKTTDKSARPSEWERSLARSYATQAVFYPHVVSAAWKRPVGPMRFIVFERKPPYAVAVIQPGETMVDAAHEEMLSGVRRWAMATITGHWPGYGTDIHMIEAPLHMMQRAEAAKLDFGRIAA